MYDLGASTWPVHATSHVPTWLDAVPSHLASHGVQDVEKAKKKLFGIDRNTGQLKAPGRAYTAGDLVAALDFGFWTGLFSKPYLFQGRHDPRLWPHGFGQVFPYADTRITLHEISGRLNHLRQLRNRVFHHEPIWRRNLTADRDNILQLVTWMSPETAQVVSTTERLSEVVSDDYRRRLRIRIYHEARG